MNRKNNTGYRTPNGHIWPCNNRECQEERDTWEDCYNLVHCKNPQCHGVLCIETDGVGCKICGRFCCETCAMNISGRYTNIYSDLTRKQLKGYSERDFLCYSCVPRYKLKKHDKTGSLQSG